MKQHRNGSILWITVLGLFCYSICFLLVLVAFYFAFCAGPCSLFSNRSGGSSPAAQRELVVCSTPCVEGLKMINIHKLGWNIIMPFVSPVNLVYTCSERMTQSLLFDKNALRSP